MIVYSPIDIVPLMIRTPETTSITAWNNAAKRPSSVVREYDSFPERKNFGKIALKPSVERLFALAVRRCQLNVENLIKLRCNCGVKGAVRLFLLIRDPIQKFPQPSNYTEIHDEENDGKHRES